MDSSTLFLKKFLTALELIKIRFAVFYSETVQMQRPSLHMYLKMFLALELVK